MGKEIIMSEVKQLDIGKVSKFDSDFIFSMNLKVKVIYTGIYGDEKCEAIISFLNGRDISVVEDDKLLIEVDKVVFFTILFKKITKDYVTIKTPDKSKIKSDIKMGVDLSVCDDLTLDFFKKEIRTRI